MIISDTVTTLSQMTSFNLFSPSIFHRYFIFLMFAKFSDHFAEINLITQILFVKISHKHSIYAFFPSLRLLPSLHQSKIAYTGRKILQNIHSCVGRDSVAVMATRYGQNSMGIEFQWGQNFLHPSRPSVGAHPSPVG